MKKAEAHVQLKPGIIGVRVKIMPPDAVFPDRIKILAAIPEEEKVAVPEQAPVAPAPTQTEEAPQAAEPEPQPEVQATEVKDEPKPEETKA
jgi:small subunit ribosomal protein S3